MPGVCICVTSFYHLRYVHSGITRPLPYHLTTLQQMKPKPKTVLINVVIFDHICNCFPTNVDASHHFIDHHHARARTVVINGLTLSPVYAPASWKCDNIANMSLLRQ